LNHEQHLQEAVEEIKELKFQQTGILEKIDVDHEAIIRLLQMHKL
jgi:hypothetical protein